MSRKDILNRKPCRTDNEEVKWFYEDKIVIITYPKKFGKMEKWLQSRIGGPEEVRRPLDKFSSYIWEICDGEATVADVVRKFDEKFGEEVAPAPDRVQSREPQSLTRNMRMFTRNRLLPNMTAEIVRVSSVSSISLKIPWV